MTKFVHTIKDSEPVKQENTVEIEWSLKTDNKGWLTLYGNRKAILYILPDGQALSTVDSGKELGLPHDNHGKLIVS